MVATGRPSLPTSLGIACLLGVLAAGCGNPLPGTLLGTYQVTATAGANSCGSGLGAPGVYQFDVQLSETSTDSLLHWSWLDDAPIATGTLARVSSSDPSLQASLTSSQSSNVDATTAGAGPCTMVRADSMVVTLGAGTPPGSFAGTMSYAFTAASGADCTDQLTASGGMYAKLPCTITYAIAGARQ
jgi:hypothetical protein